MSVESIAVVLHHSKATGTDRLVLLGVANHEGDGGAFPSIDTLMKYTLVGRRAVQRSLRALEAMGELRTHPNRGGDVLTRGGRQRPNLYEVLVRCPPDCDRTTQHRTTQGGGADATPQDDEGAVAEAKGAVAGPPQGAVAGPPEPSLQPPIEPSFAADAASADDLTREWWERNRDEHNYRPSEGHAFVASRKIVESTIDAGYDAREVRAALARIGPRVFTKKSLRDQCYAIRVERERAGPKRPYDDDPLVGRVGESDG